MVVSNSINQMYEEMKSWRQDLHSIPEIGLEEYETSKYIKSKLSEFNIEMDKSGGGNIIQAAAAGIEVALLTTCFGLIVGIPAFMAFNYFSSVINGFVLHRSI